jgi:asparagine synthetase B (glutamine-hydrolysing)
MYTSSILTASDVRELYIQYKCGFVEDITGEYSIVIIDKVKEKIVIFTDTVSTKNIFYAFYKKGVIIASRESIFKERGIKEYIKVPVSTILEISVRDFKVLNIRYHSKFYLNENKNTYDDCISILEESIRVRCTGSDIAVGMSSGHDSGCILQAAINTSSLVNCYYVHTGSEDKNIILDRKNICNKNNINLKTIDYYSNRFLYDAYEKVNLKNKMENYEDFEKEPSTNLISRLFRNIKKDGIKVYVTGLAGDEITQQYVYQIKGQNTKCFNWMPTFDLYSDGREHNELDQNEFISEIYNIEVRYPFLDRRFIQEFLNLSAKYKEQYKGVLEHYLNIYKMSFSAEKIGFSLKDSESPTRLQKL